MTGGILQLVAKGAEDIWMIINPSVTFFKTVYRRHTNMSKTEIPLHFNSKLNFGQKSVCRIENYGDLLHRLFLRIKLPGVEAQYKFLTIKEVQVLLKTYNIIWDGNGKEASDKYDVNDYNSIVHLINQKVLEINNELTIVNSILFSLENDSYFVPHVWRDWNHIFDNKPESIDKYFDEILSHPQYGFFQYDQYDLTYKMINSHIKDIKMQYKINNSTQIQNNLLSKFIDYAVTRDTNVNTHNDDNIQFMYNVDTANYFVSGSVDLINVSTTFRSSINDIYGNLIAYENLDGYKVFDKLLRVNSPITSSADINNIRLQLLDNIRFNLIKNIKYLKNIYISLNNNYQFIFYRKFGLITINVYDTSSSFVNNSTITNPVSGLEDKFTEDFNLEPEPNEPTDVTFEFGSSVLNSLNNFNLANSTLFKNSFINTYMNDITNLWIRLNIATNPYTPTGITTNPNMYFMNYVWLTMNDDINNSITTYVTDHGTLPNPDLIAFIFGLEEVHDTIRSNIEPTITRLVNYNISSLLHNNVKRNLNPLGDIVIFGDILPGMTNCIYVYKFKYLIIYEYIVQYYTDYINEFIPTDMPAYLLIKKIILDIIGLFVTPLDLIPTYSEYVARHYNILNTIQINEPGTNPQDRYYDVQASIWNYLFGQFVNNFNTLYNTDYLSPSVYKTTLGSELNIYLETTLSLIGNTTSFDYFRRIDTYVDKLPNNSDGSIGIYLDNKLSAFKFQLQIYDANRLLLNMRDILFQKSKTLYEKFKLIVELLTNIIEDNFNLYKHIPHGSPTTDIVLIEKKEFTKTYAPNDPTQYNVGWNNALDIVDILNLVVNTFITTIHGSNPYTNLPIYFNGYANKSTLWEQYNLKNVNIPVELNKFYELFEWILADENFLGGYKRQNELDHSRAENLYKYYVQIVVLYNGFELENNIYQFMADYVIQNSILKDLPPFKGFTIETTYAQIYKYYLDKKDYDDNLLSRINGTQSPFVSLNDILVNGLRGGSPANFAWIQKLGHYIIEDVWIDIDDQIMDKHSGEWLEIWHQLTRNMKKEKGYNKLIGNVNLLTLYNREPKRPYELIIPLQFWFNRNIGNSLPLIGLFNASVKLNVKLRDLASVSYMDPFTTFRKRPKLECDLIGEFMFVDIEERKRLATSKLEYLIDVVQYNGNLVVGPNDLGQSNIVEVETRFKNPCKEIIWMMQDISLIDGTSNLGQKMWDQYVYEGVNPIKQVKIKFNRRDRETFKDIEFYNLIQPQERHQATPAIGVNCYAFALNPESVQSTGTANMSKIDDVIFEMILNDQVIEAIRNYKKFFRLPFYAVTINVVRMVSGLCGLVYYY